MFLCICAVGMTIKMVYIVNLYPLLLLLLEIRHLHLPVLVRAADGEEPLQGDAEHDVDAGHETEG